MVAACVMYAVSVPLAAASLVRGGSTSSVLKSEGPMAMMVPKWSWYAVAMAPLEMHRRMECRSAGLIFNNLDPSGSRLVTAPEALMRVSSASAASESGQAP